MKRIWFLVLAVSVGLNVGLLFTILTPDGTEPTGARPPGRPPLPKDMDVLLAAHLRRMTDSLELNDVQRSAIAAIHDDLLPGIGAQHREMSELRQALATHYEGPRIDPAEFRSLARRLSETQAKLDALVTEAMLGEAAVLSDEQRRKYAREMPWRRAGAPPPPDKGPEDRKKGR